MSFQARDNISIFADCCVGLGMRRSDVCNYSNFEKGDLKQITATLCAFAKLGIPKGLHKVSKELETYVEQAYSPKFVGMDDLQEEDEEIHLTAEELEQLEREKQEEEERRQRLAAAQEEFFQMKQEFLEAYERAVEELCAGVMDDIDLYIGAYAKSMASIGGFVAGPKVIIDYLRYNLRSQIYAKSLPMAFVEGGLKRLEIIRSKEGDELRKKLFTVTRALQKGFRDLGFEIGPAEACVTPVAIKGGVAQATKMAVDLRENYGIFCSIVVYPVIPKGMIIFRIIPTAAHSMEDVEYTLKTFAEVRAKLDRGEYDGDEIVDRGMLE